MTFKTKDELLNKIYQTKSPNDLKKLLAHAVIGLRKYQEEERKLNIARAKMMNYPDSADWALKERTFKGKPWSFNGLETWIPFHQDRHNNLLVRKPRQVTFSEQVMNKVFHYMIMNPYESVLHTFHQQVPASDFSKERYANCIRNCLMLVEAENRRDIHTRSFEFRIGDEQFLYILGTKTGGGEGVAGAQVLSKTPGMIVFDERQDQEQNVKTYVGESLGFKPNAKTITGGTSRTPGNPLELEYQQSDQKLCLYKCPSCNTWNWPEIQLIGREWSCKNILTLRDAIEDQFGNPKKHIFICSKCGKSLDHYRGKYGKQDDGGNIQWVSQKVDSRGKPITDYYSGYFFTRFEVGFYNLTTHIINRISDTARTLREVSNDILGIPYAGDDCPFNMTLLNGCKAPQITMEGARTVKYKLIVGTLDWGAAPGSYAYVEGITEDNRAISLGWNCIQGPEAEHGKMAAEWFKSMGCNIVICDWGYKAGREKHLKDAFGISNVFMVMYDTGVSKSLTFDSAGHFDLTKIMEGVVVVDRNYAIENMQRQLYGGTDYWIIPYSDPKLVDPYLIQFTNIFKVDPRENKTTSVIGRDTYKYERSGPDHSAHCKIYASLVLHPETRRLFDRELRVV